MIINIVYNKNFKSFYKTKKNINIKINPIK